MHNPSDPNYAPQQSPYGAPPQYAQPAPFSQQAYPPPQYPPQQAYGTAPQPMQYGAQQPQPYGQQAAGYPSDEAYNPPKPPKSNTSSSYDPEAGQEDTWGDIPADKRMDGSLPMSIRHAFVRKVYGVLFVQLLITFGIALMFNLWDAAGVWLYQNFWLMIVAVVMEFVLLIVLVCIPGMARKVPLNFFFLMSLSVCFGIVMGYAAAAVTTYAFSVALGITALLVLSISIFACQTKWDFTGCGPFVMVSLLCLMMFGILAWIIPGQTVHMVYASIGAALFSFYLVYDTQQIVGGKHRKYQYSIDDYIFASLSLFLDIVNIFVFILTLVGGN